MKYRHLLLLAALLVFNKCMLEMRVLGQQPSSQIVPQLGHTGAINSMSFSRDGKLLATASNDGTVKIWAATTGDLIRTLAAHNSGVSKVVFDSLGRNLVSAGSDGIKFWDVETGVERKKFAGALSLVKDIAFSPNGKLLAGAGYGANASGDEVVVWDTSGSEVRRLGPNNSSVNAVAFSPDGKVIASSDTNMIKLWNAGDGRQLRIVQVSSGTPDVLVFSPDGRILASAESNDSSRGISLWNPQTGTLLRSIKTTYTVDSLAFSPDGKILADGEGFRAELHDVSTGRSLTAFQNLWARIANSVAFSPDGHLLAVAGTGVQFIDVATGENRRGFFGYQAPVNSIAFSAADEWLITGTSVGQVVVWDLANGRLIKKFKAGEWSLVSAVMSDPLPVEHIITPNGQLLVARTKYQNRLDLFETATGGVLRSLPADNVGAAAFDEQGKLIAAAHHVGDTEKIEIWETATGKSVRSFNDIGRTIQYMVFSPDGQTLAAGTTRYPANIRIWDLKTGTELPSLKSQTQTFAKIEFAFTPDSKALALKTGVSELKLLDLATRKELRVFQTPAATLRSLRFNHTGKLLAGAFGTTIQVWDVGTGQVVLKLEGHASNVNSLAFSHDDHIIASGSSDSRVILWDLATGARLVDLVAFANQNWLALTPDDRYDGTPDSLQWMRVVDGMQSAPLHSFTAKPFTPQLITRQLYGVLSTVKRKPADTFDPTDSPPTIKIQSPVSNFVTDAEKVEVAVTVKDNGSGIGKVQLFQNGRKIAEQDGASGEVKFLVQLIPSINELRATASNFYGKESEAAVVRVEHRIKAADLLKPELVVQTAHNASILAVVFNPNGSMLASASVDNTVVLWDAITGKQVRTFGGKWERLAFSPDSEKLAGWAVPQVTGGTSNTIVVWDLATGRELRSITENDERIKTIPEAEWFKATRAVSPDGTVSAVSTGEVIYLNLRGGQSRSLVGHSGGIQTLVFNRDGRLLASSADDNTIKLWDVATGLTLQTLTGHAKTVNTLAFSPDGKTLASGGEDAVVIIWDTVTGQELATLKSRASRANDIAFSPDGKWLYEVRRSGVNRFNLATGRLANSFPARADEDVTAVTALSYAGDLLATGSFGITLRDTKTGKILQELWNGQSTWVNSIAFSADGKLLAGANQNASVSLWEVSTGKHLYTLENRHRDVVVAVAFSPDSKLFASAGGSDGETGQKFDGDMLDNRTEVDNRILISEVGSGRQLLAIAGHKDGVLALAWHPENKNLLASAGGDGAVKLWDPSTGKELRVLGRFTSAVGTLAWNRDGTLIAAADHRGMLKLWDLASGRELRSFQAHTRPINGLAFSPAGKLLATSSNDATTRLWDLAGSELAVLTVIDNADFITVTPEGFYTASRGALRGVAFRAGNRALPIEQLDLKLNRPDKVAEKLGHATRESIDAYHLVYLKRLKRLSIATDAIDEATHFPDVTITDTNLPTSTEVQKLTFNIRSSDATTTIDRLDVFVNGAPVFGAGGLSLKERTARVIEQPVTVELSRGKNHIEISALNARGFASLTRSFDVFHNAPPAKPELYVVVVGVSQYAESKYNLNYAAKDARDLLAYFEGRKEIYARVNKLELLDTNATRTKILQAKDFLMRSRVDDQVVVFFAGHGLLDGNLDYYFGTHDIEFKNPAEHGLPFNELESLLDSAAARQKLLLMDTCHAGEFDKQAVQVTAASSASSPVKMRMVPRSDIVGTEVVQLNDSIEMQQELFADLRRGSGAFVIAAAAGAEYAYEDSEWDNGVFTFSLLEALKTGHADIDGDGQVRVAELRDYVSERVRSLTDNRQRPTTRKENAEFDYAVASRPALRMNLRLAGGVESVSFSPDGKLLLTGDKSTRLWNAVTGEQLRVFRASVIKKAVFSHDGQLIATSDYSRLRLWNAATGEEKVPTNGLLTPWEISDGAIRTLAFSPDGKWLVAGAQDGTKSLVKVWDMSGREVRTFTSPSQVNSLIFSPNGKFVAAASEAFGSQDNTFVVIWDAASGKELFALKQEKNATVRVAFSPDSKVLAVTIVDDEAEPKLNKLKFIDPPTGKVVQEVIVPAQAGYSSAVSFSPDGRTIATASFDGKLNLWDSATRRLLRTIEAHTRWINAVAFSPDGELIATASADSTVRIWKTKEE